MRLKNGIPTGELKVRKIKAGNEYIPQIVIAGAWLEGLGYLFGRNLKYTADKNTIKITREN
jgi:hypothetical protein